MERKRRKERVESTSQSKKPKHDSDKNNDGSSSCERHSKKEKDFSFYDFRSELNVIYLRDAEPAVVADFWKFLKKFESFKGKESLRMDNVNCTPAASGSSPWDIPKQHDSSHGVCISFVSPPEKYFSRLRVPVLSLDKIIQFQKILLLYKDFKQKERFTKLYKLRQSQKNLPVTQFREKIISSVKEERVVIIAGDTGCGKSTQVPQYLLKAGFEKIACTQPRRIACISLCKRVSFETLSENNSDVGYQIRFERTRRESTKITFITEGLLLRQVFTDPSLSCYDVIVLDEVHERHLHGDFLLGVVKCLLYQRSDLKVVLMSATINLELFSKYFPEAAVLQVPGRLHPIKLYYKPISIEDQSTKSGRINPAPYVRILQLIDDKYPKEERGDVLIFMSGMSEITTVVDAAKLYAEKTQSWIILALHSSLSLSEQDKVFDYAPDGVRKCIVSTNIAETSITIDGIRFVIDSGKMKEMSYEALCKMKRLKEFWISKASAEQRKGRAGRTGPGVCYRLYSEEQYTQLDEYSTPEIQRVPLDSVLLQMVAMGLPNARKFPFIEPPPSDSIENAILVLKQHGALDDAEKLTPMGRMLSNLPVDIGLGKMLIMSSLFHHLQPVLSLAAALSVQSPFTNRAHRDPDCEVLLREFESDHGDPFILLNIFCGWLKVKSERGNSRTWCRHRGLEEQRFYEMVKLRSQFKDLLQECGLMPIADTSKMSSADRILMHGERSLLRSKQRSYKETPTNRKRLRLDVWQIQEEEENENDTDIGDIEFRLGNSGNKIQELLTGTTTYSFKDMIMLKIILCSGIYPQIAVADEFNNCKSAPEQLFHTESKPYVALHPMGYFGNHPQVLQLGDSDIATTAHSTLKSPVSMKHQLLCYLSLLETTKPYLVTCVRMPAANTLLLFSQAIDTDRTFSRFICDGWLQLFFPLPNAAADILMKAAQIRQKWTKLQQLQLEGSTTQNLAAEVSREIIAFMQIDILFSIKRLLAADRKILYVGPDQNNQSVEPNPFCAEWTVIPHPDKGGVRINSFITYNCLFDTDEQMDEIFDCENCGLSAPLSVMEKLQHKFSCIVQESSESTNQPDDENGYKCEVCHKVLHLTPTQILHHRKQHKKTAN